MFDYKDYIFILFLAFTLCILFDCILKSVAFFEVSRLDKINEIVINLKETGYSGDISFFIK